MSEPIGVTGRLADELADGRPATSATPAGSLAWTESGFEVVQGESLSVDELLVISPCDGALRGREAAEGQHVVEGQVVARVAGADGQVVPVHSPFAGRVLGFLVPVGSPVRRREPVLWLRRHF